MIISIFKILLKREEQMANSSPTTTKPCTMMKDIDMKITTMVGASQRGIHGTLRNRVLIVILIVGMVGRRRPLFQWRNWSKIPLFVLRYTKNSAPPQIIYNQLTRHAQQQTSPYPMMSPSVAPLTYRLMVLYV